MCKYCEKITSKTETYDDNGKVEFRHTRYEEYPIIVKDREGAFIQSDYIDDEEYQNDLTFTLLIWDNLEEFSYQDVKINYCPWCGRKLK